MKSLLVIGGTGFIGYYIIKEAKKKGYKITSISLNKPKKKRYQKGVKYITVDLLNFKELKKKINNNYDYVVNAGGYGSHPEFGQDGNKLIESHFLGLLNILQILLKKKQLKKFIQIGSSAEYGQVKAPINELMVCRPKTPYAIAKLSCTNILLYLHETQKFPVIILRLFLVYGGGQKNNRFIPQIINGCIKQSSFPVSAGNQIRDFCYIDDVVKAILLSMNCKKGFGQVINIASGKPIKVKSIVISTQHSSNVDQKKVKEIVRPYLEKSIPKKLLSELKEEEFYVNPTGQFIIGGPDGDSGLTGRKIIVDTYGGAAPHGGGAFSGKDPSKVDRSAAYAARYVAKNVVASVFHQNLDHPFWLKKIKTILLKSCPDQYKMPDFYNMDRKNLS